MPHVKFEKYWYCDYCDFHAFTKEAVEKHEKNCPEKFRLGDDVITDE